MRNLSSLQWNNALLRRCISHRWIGNCRPRMELVGWRTTHPLSISRFPCGDFSILLIETSQKWFKYGAYIFFLCGILYEIFHHHFWNPHSRWVLVTNQMMISQCKMVYLPPDYPSVCVLLNHHKIVAMQSQFLQQEIHLQDFSDKSFDPGTCLGLYLQL